ncbi:MAG: hypothetical protein L3J34_12545 [Flavobacteriaceae bacterium]|nr:hypothetical protein [Flavobacteriaceae bacterium]
MVKAGKAKNTQNKAKHKKLVQRKKRKLRTKKEAKKQRLKELTSQINAQKLNDK